MTQIKKLGLTLGGGGARGAAHVGAIIELKKLGVEPDLITGTSIGGLIGALYAAGVSDEKMVEFFSDLNIASVFRIPTGSPSMTGNNRFRKLLEKAIGSVEFEALSIPLSVVTVDLKTRREVVVDTGDVITAVLATCAIPVAFPAVKLDNMLLVDGGLVNNTPFDVTRARGATTVIAVNLTRAAPYGTPTTDLPPPKGVIGRAIDLAQRGKLFQVATAAIDIMTTQGFNMRLAIARPEVLIRPHMGTLGIFDFHRWEEGIELGKQAVKDNQADIEAALEQHYR